MKLPRTKKVELEPADNTNGSRLARAFQELQKDDADGVLNAVEESVQEIETKLKAMEAMMSDDESDDFQAADELPASCAVDEEGHMFTTEEVTNALQRSELGSSSKSPISPRAGGPPVDGLRSRKTKARPGNQKEVTEGELEEQEVTGIFGTSSKPSKWSLSSYLQSVASTREKRVVAVSAWALSLIGLIISLVFVTRDFLQSKSEMSSTVRYMDSKELDLPSIWLCSIDSQFPPFVDLPNSQYRGEPAIWLDKVYGTHANLSVGYPLTQRLPQMRIASYNMQAKECTTVTKLDPMVFLRENTAKPSCFYCITIDRNPALTIRRSSSLATARNSPQSASFRVSQHVYPYSCRRSQFGLARNSFYFFRERIKDDATELAKRGIVDFGGYDAKNATNNQYLWPLYRVGYKNATVDFVVFDVVDMFCNVYMFSDYFFPSTSQNVKFKFNTRTFRWERSGSGTYYPPEFSDFYSSAQTGLITIDDNPAIAHETFENSSLFAGQTIQVMTNYSQRGGVDTFVTLRPREISRVELTRSLIQGRETFEAHVLRTSLEAVDTRTVNAVYFLNVGFRTFMTRVVTDQQSVSWSAFIADFFGLTSLFLDVSVYTLIVSPLIMRARKRALIARKMRRAGDSSV